MIIVLKLCIGEKVVPVILPLINKETEELLQFLVDPLCLSVSLGVVCGSGCQLNSEESVQLFGEFRYKLGASVRYYSFGQPVMFPNMLEVELCSPGGGQGSDCTDKVTLFGQGIHYNHDGVFPVRFWELRYEVNADGVPRRIRDWGWVQFPGQKLANRLCAEAHIACRHILAYVPRHLWPPVIPRN